MGRAGALIAVVAVIAILVVVMAHGWHLPKLQTSPVPKPSKPHYIDLKYYLSRGYRIVRRLHNNTYVLKWVKVLGTILKPTNRTIKEVILSDVAVAKLRKPVRLYRLFKDVGFHIIKFKVVNGTKGYGVGDYGGEKYVPTNKFCLGTLPDKITIKLNLSKYLEIWEKENHYLVKRFSINLRNVKVRNVVTAFKLGEEHYVFVELPVPLITKYYDNDTYLRYVVVPLIKKVIMRVCGVKGTIGHEDVAYAIKYFVLGRPYNESSVEWSSWEYVIAYGGVCMHLSRLAVAIATYLGWKSVAAVGELHEIALLCEPWWQDQSGFKYIIKLANNETLVCHTWVNTGSEISRIDYLEIYELHNYFKEVKLLSYKISYKIG